MTKFDLIELLKSNREDTSKLELRKREKTNYEIELKQLEKIENETNMTTSFGINNDIHSQNIISDKVSNAIIRREDREAELREKIKEAEKEIKELEEKTEEVKIRLNSLYYKEREILTAYYVDNRAADEIGRNLYFKLYNRTCTQQNIYKIIEKATNRMIKL